jgi:hypothetical protein
MAGGSFILFYLALRLHMWREYYRFSKITPHARKIDRGDKILAALFATGLALIWPISLTMYLIRRHLIAQRRRRIAGAYADRMMRRWDVDGDVIGEADAINTTGERG